jgi:hypothetical protein
MCATGNFFDVLGVRARVGRTLQSFDDGPAADHDVAVGTYTFWRDRYQLDPNAIGSTVQIRSRPFTLVGFLPEGFEGIRKGLVVDVYVPTAAMTDACLGSWGGGSTVEAIGLLARDTSRPAASAELAQLWTDLKNSGDYAPGIVDGQLTVSNASRGISAVDGNEKTSLYLLACGVALIVLLGCLNVSCLLSVQGVDRRNEIALRRARRHDGDGAPADDARELPAHRGGRRRRARAGDAGRTGHPDLAWPERSSHRTFDRHTRARLLAGTRADLRPRQWRDSGA